VKVGKQLGKILQGQIPPVKRQAVAHMMEEGTIRKFAAILRHRKVGYTFNAMVLWAVPKEKIEETGQLFASLPEVTHCYERAPAFEAKYNLFTMVHFRNENFENELNKLVDASGIKDHKTLISLEEFKKSSMEYFRHGE